MEKMVSDALANGKEASLTYVKAASGMYAADTSTNIQLVASLDINMRFLHLQLHLELALERHLHGMVLRYQLRDLLLVRHHFFFLDLCIC